MSIAMFEKKQIYQIRARRFDNGETVVIQRQEDSIRSLMPSGVEGDGSWWIAPPLFDLQVNGFAGVDFQDPELTQADLRRAIRGLTSHGCGKFFPTLVTNRWELILEKLGRIRRWRDTDPEFQLSIAGYHIEEIRRAHV